MFTPYSALNVVRSDLSVSAENQVLRWILTERFVGIQFSHSFTGAFCARMERTYLGVGRKEIYMFRPWKEQRKGDERGSGGMLRGAVKFDLTISSTCSYQRPLAQSYVVYAKAFRESDLDFECIPCPKVSIFHTVEAYTTLSRTCNHEPHFLHMLLSCQWADLVWKGIAPV